MLEPIDEFSSLMILEMGIPKQPQQALQTLPEDAFALHRLGRLAAGTEMTSPCEAVEEGKCHDGEEFFQFDPISHVSGLKIEAPLFEMTEELFDAPSQTIDRQRFPAAESVAHYVEVTVAPIVSGDRLVGEEQMKSPYRHPGGGAFAGLARGSVQARRPAVDQRVSLDAHNEADPLVIKPAQPAGTSEFPVHGQNPDLLGSHQAEHLGEHLDPLCGVGVAAFGGLRQNFPDDGDCDAVDDHANGEDVDVALSIFPVGAVHRKGPALRRSGKLPEDKSPNRRKTEGTPEEEVLESPVAALVPGTGEVFGCEDGEVHGAVTQQAGDQQGQALESGEIEVEGGIEFVDEMCFEHPNFGRPSAMQAFSRYFSLIFNELGHDFLSCSVIAFHPYSTAAGGGRL